MPKFEPVLLARIDKPDSASLASYRADGGYEALKKALGDGAGRRHEAGEGRGPARPRRGGFPVRAEVDVPAEEPSGPDLPVRQRRRERAGHVQQPHPHGGGSAPAARRASRSPATRSARTRRTSICATSTAAATACSMRRSSECYAAGLLGKNILGSGFELDIYLHRGAGGVHLRRRDGADRKPRRQAGLAADQAAVSRRSKGCSASRRSSTTSRRCAA